MRAAYRSCALRTLPGILGHMNPREALVLAPLASDRMRQVLGTHRVDELAALLLGGSAMALSRDDILKQEGPATEVVHVPEWGGEVVVRGMTGKERDEWEAGNFRQMGKRMVSNPANLRARLLVFCCVDEDGKRLFTHGDIEALSAKSAQALDRVFEVAARLSGITGDDVEEMTRDFENPNGDSSFSDSPRISTRPSGSSAGKPTATS